MPDGERHAPIQAFRQKAVLFFNFSQAFSLRLAGEHYFNNTVDQGRHFDLADMGLNHNYRKIRFSLDWTNISDTRRYAVASLSDLAAYQNSYDIRPMALMLKLRFKLF